MAITDAGRTSPARSTAEAQRTRVVAHAVRVFARTGYHATPVTDVAAAAGISPAYIFRLFPGKLGLFVAAVEHCYELMRRAMERGADTAPADADPGQVLAAMGDAYVELIRDRDVLMLALHAQSATDVPEIRRAVQRGVGEVVGTVRVLSGAEPHAVQQFMAVGLLCQLIVTADLDRVQADWAATLTTGIKHLDELHPDPVTGAVPAERSA